MGLMWPLFHKWVHVFEWYMTRFVIKKGRPTKGICVIMRLSNYMFKNIDTIVG